ncbi:hypothetical protein ACFLTH_08840 [Bacteroidota bacterium]
MLNNSLSAQDLNSPFNAFFDQPVFDKILAEVGSIKITAEEFFYSYEFGPAFIKKSSDSKERHLKYMINEKLMAADGYSRSIDTSEQVTEMHEAFKRDLATEELFKDEIMSKVEISEEDVDTLVSHKQLEIELKWIYAFSYEQISSHVKSLREGISFDSLYKMQFNDSLFVSDRYMKIDRYQLEQKNHPLAQIIDTLKIGDITAPIHTSDGWYIMKIENVWRNMITTESEKIKLREESIRALTKRRMDQLSDKYVREIMLSNNPVIKGSTFAIARAYIGRFQLPEGKIEEWDLSKKLNEAIENLESWERDDLSTLILVEMTSRDVTLGEFLIWYRGRDQYLKFDKTDINSFSASLEQYIWRMIRDELLSKVAREKDYFDKEIVKKQSKWWKDKIVYSSVRNELTNSIMIENTELGSNKLEDYDAARPTGEIISEELAIKMLRTIQKLKQKYPVTINNEVLSTIKVTSENDPAAMEVYSVKKGGLIPRPAYPTIDFDWQSWE